MADQTTLAMAMAAGAEVALRLAIIAAGQLSLFPLPRRGVVLIGRGASADVRVDDSRVSREHARLHIGACLEIEDLDSANGTLVQNRPIPPFTRVVVQPTEGVSVGGAVLMVQPADALGARETHARAKSGEHRVNEPPARVVIEDDQMKRLYEMATRVAASNINVLILGETGTGKELLAETIHARSERSGKTFLCLNCASISESLLESELFGHVRGAFTGAHQAKVGLLETAAGGSVFLDEVGEMAPSIQAKLLRVLETRQVMRVGGAEPRSIDVRFVSATNRNLVDEVTQGRFRRDLYFRLNTVTLQLPPLRERRSEIWPLAERFVAVSSAEERRARAPSLSKAARSHLEAYSWPGNVRELRNAIQHAVLLCDTEIRPEHLLLGHSSLSLPPRTVAESDASPTPTSPTPTRPLPTRPTPTSPAEPPAFRSELHDLERRRILEAIEVFAGNQTRAAEHLGISRRTLLKRLDEYGAARPRKRPRAG